VDAQPDSVRLRAYALPYRRVGGCFDQEHLFLDQEDLLREQRHGLDESGHRPRE
jgi:hypothetical protein